VFRGNDERDVRIMRAVIVCLFLAFAALVRVLPHPWNFTPVGAMALFSGAKLGRSYKAFLLPLTALLLGDVFVGFYRLMWVVYLSFCVSVLIGMWFRKRQKTGPLALATVLGAAQFFVITNGAVWAFLNTYPKTLAGLASCYVAGLPLFGNTLAGDALYCVLLFGGFAVVERWKPGIRTRAAELG
jgi:uncharacterized protein DUF6580